MKTIHEPVTFSGPQFGISHDALRQAVNDNCTCGGKPQEDPETCPACLVWHQLAPKPEPARADAAQDAPFTPTKEWITATIARAAASTEEYSRYYDLTGYIDEQPCVGMPVLLSWFPDEKDALTLLHGNGHTRCTRATIRVMRCNEALAQDARQQPPACQKNVAEFLTEKDAVAQENTAVDTDLQADIQATQESWDKLMATGMKPAVALAKIIKRHKEKLEQQNQSAPSEARYPHFATPEEQCKALDEINVGLIKENEALRKQQSEAQARVTELEAKLAELNEEIEEVLEECTKRIALSNDFPWTEEVQCAFRALEADKEQAVAKERANLAEEWDNFHIDGVSMQDRAAWCDEVGRSHTALFLRWLHARLANPASAEKGDL